MDIGEPQRVITVEPLEDPVPRRRPGSPPDAEPSELDEVMEEPEKVAP